MTLRIDRCKIHKNCIAVHCPNTIAGLFIDINIDASVEIEPDKKIYHLSFGRNKKSITDRVLDFIFRR